MKARTKTFGYCGLVLMLAACSVPERLLNYMVGPPPGADSSMMDQLIAANAARAIVRIPKHGLASTVLEEGQRDGVRRWRALDNVQVYTRDGIIVGTRGVGHDLMTADPSRASDIITTEQNGQSIRIHRMLNGQDRLEIHSYVCDITAAGDELIRVGETEWTMTRRMDEKCYNPRGGFINHYWVRDGRIVQTDQVYADDIGRVNILFLP